MLLAVYFAEAKQDHVAAILLATMLVVFSYLVSFFASRSVFEACCHPACGCYCTWTNDGTKCSPTGHDVDKMVHTAGAERLRWCWRTSFQRHVCYPRCCFCVPLNGAGRKIGTTYRRQVLKSIAHRWATCDTFDFQSMLPSSAGVSSHGQRFIAVGNELLLLRSQGRGDERHSP